MKYGDFSGLAESYRKYRPDYSNSVLAAVLGLVKKEIKDVDFVDVGAGTGIWTKMVYDKKVSSVKAIEPNLEMLEEGKIDTHGKKIEWIQGTAEKTQLKSNSADWISMASSFHWADFEKALAEFNRVLRKEAIFTVLWNPRVISENPILVEIEDYLKFLKPNLKRVSSGKTIDKEELINRFQKSNFFDDVIYIEGRHVINMPIKRYIGAWKSVNDIQVQLGKDKFTQFLEHIKNKTKNKEYIETTYLTRSWTARKIH